VLHSFGHQLSLSGCLLALSRGGYYIVYQRVADGSDGHTHRTHNEGAGGSFSFSFVQMTDDLSVADFGSTAVCYSIKHKVQLGDQELATARNA
jgi:hypothetical protein